ncbi:MAG: diguanylate cyclase [Candidatus Zipacnadales bacterium]
MLGQDSTASHAEEPPLVVLVVGSPSADTAALTQLLRTVKVKSGFTVVHSQQLSQGLERLASDDINAVVVDLGIENGNVEIVESIHRAAPQVPLFVLTAQDDETMKCELIRRGAEDVFPKSELHSQWLVRVIELTVAQKQLQAKLTARAHELEALEANLRTLVENSTDALVVLDMQGAIQLINAAARCLLSHDARELVGAPLDYLATSAEKVDLEVITWTGVPRTVEMRVVVVSWGGEPAYLAVLRDVTERRGNEEELRRASVTDELTGLYNRRGFETLAEQHLKLALRHQRPAALIFVDLNGLKQLNDRFGHAAGDEALIEVAEVLRRTFRESDIIARWGGDEFVILALECPPASHVLLLNRLQQNLHEHNTLRRDHPVKLGLTAGVVTYDPSESCSLDELLRRADEEMYRHKPL